MSPAPSVALAIACMLARVLVECDLTGLKVRFLLNEKKGILGRVGWGRGGKGVLVCYYFGSTHHVGRGVRGGTSAFSRWRGARRVQGGTAGARVRWKGDTEGLPRG